MTKEQIIEIIETSFNEKTGSNEAIDDAAFYIAAKYEADITQSKLEARGEVIKEIINLLTKSKTK